MEQEYGNIRDRNGQPERCNKVESLRMRIRELEQVIQGLNGELEGKKTLERTHNAVLENLVKVKAENGVLKIDRDRYFAQAEFFENQGAKITKENDSLHEKCDYLNKRLIELNRNVRQLEQENRSRVGLGSTCDQHAVQTVGEVEDQTCDNHPPPRAIVVEEDTCEQPPVQGVGNVENNVFDQPLFNCKRRKTSLQTPQTCPITCKYHIALSDNIFHQNTECCFNQTIHQPLKVWQDKLVDVHGKMDVSEAHIRGIWPCCGTHGGRKQHGCLNPRHHQKVEPDARVECDRICSGLRRSPVNSSNKRRVE